MKYKLLIILKIVLILSSNGIFAQNHKPCVSFSFDDGNPNDILSYKGEVWNAMIRDQLKHSGIKAVWFVAANKLNNENGKLLLQVWNNDGHLIANHTYHHLNYNKPSVSFGLFVHDIQKCDSLIDGYPNYRKIFRFPVLKQGNTVAKRDSIQNWLLQNGYKQGWVTIDASDWYYNQRLLKLLKENPNAGLKGLREAFVAHIFDRAVFYDKLSMEINQREIKHVVLLHFNLTSALFLTDLIKKFKAEGWNIANYGDAIEDPVYSKLPDVMPAEQSLIWLQAKESGKYEAVLRYPGEDGEYEKEKLDKLGL